MNYFLIWLSLLASNIRASTLNLLEFENLGLSEDTQLMLFSNDEDLEKRKKETARSGYVPKINLSVTKSKSFFSESVASRSETLSVEQSLQTILGASTRQQASNISLLRLQQDKETYKQMRIFTLRSAFIALQYAMQDEEINKKQLETVVKIMSLNETQYQRGFVSQADLSRAKASFLKQTGNLQESENSLEEALKKLRYLVPSLNTRSNISFQPLRLKNPDSILIPSFAKSELEEKKLQNEIMDIELKKQSIAQSMAPDAFFSFSFTEPGGPNIALGASWTLPVTQFYERFETEVQMRSLLDKSKKLNKDSEFDWQSKVNYVKNLIDRFRKQSVLVTSYEEIDKQSSKDYANGSLSLVGYVQDLQTSLAEHKLLLAIKKELLESLAELSRQRGENDLFYSWIIYK